MEMGLAVVYVGVKMEDGEEVSLAGMRSDRVNRLGAGAGESVCPGEKGVVYAGGIWEFGSFGLR